MINMDWKGRYDLVKRNTEEILTDRELEDLLKSKKQPSAYIGMAATGRVHMGYFIPAVKIADFLKAGFRFRVLLADIHAHLDDQKAPWELLDWRVKYYKEAITGLLESIGVDQSRLEFIRGSDFELEEKYTLDMYRLSALNTFSRCKRAASEVVRFGDEPKLSGFIYPILQALDEEYLKVDVQYGGHDQRKILAFARENLPRLGYRKRVEVMTPMLPGLSGGKMSSSEEKGKIDLLDTEEDVKKKINAAYCVAGSMENNGVMAFLKYVVMTLKEDGKSGFMIERPAKFGGDVSYATYHELQNDFMEKKIHPMDVKNALAAEVNRMLEPVRKRFKGREKLLEKAYPQ